MRAVAHFFKALAAKKRNFQTISVSKISSQNLNNNWPHGNRAYGERLEGLARSSLTEDIQSEHSLASGPPLPLDIIENILESCDIETQKVFLYTSKSLRRCVFKIFLSTIEIHPPQRDNRSSWSFYRLSSILKDNPTLTPFVKSVVVRGPLRSDNLIICDFLRSLWNMQALAISRLALVEHGDDHTSHLVRLLKTLPLSSLSLYKAHDAFPLLQAGTSLKFLSLVELWHADASRPKANGLPLSPSGQVALYFCNLTRLQVTVLNVYEYRLFHAVMSGGRSSLTSCELFVNEKKLKLPALVFPTSVRLQRLKIWVDAEKRGSSFFPHYLYELLNTIVAPDIRNIELITIKDIKYWHLEDRFNRITEDDPLDIDNLNSWLLDGGGAGFPELENLVRRFESLDLARDRV